MDFIHGDAVLLGTCKDLSESGLRGTFSEDVAPGCEGLLTLYHGEKQLQMRAKIDSVVESEARIQFEYESEKERAAMTHFIKALTARPRR